MNKVNGQTPYRQELRMRILKAAMNEFFEKGIKAVKMDDIAQQLSISKRTLYEIYSNKEELLLEGMKSAEREFDEYMLAFTQKGEHNVMDVLIEFYNFQANNLAKISPLYFEELHKYERVRHFLKTKHDERDKSTCEFVERGVKEGFFRPEINYQIVIKLARESFHYAMMNHLYKEYTMQVVFRNTILLFIRGICTPKGIDMLEHIK